MTNGRITPVVLALLCVVALWACRQERQPCLTPKTASLLLETMHKATDTTTIFTDTILPAAVFTPFTIDPANRSSFLYSKAAVYGLSLSPDTTVCSWFFTTDSGNVRRNIIDTISFYYTRQLQFISNACGYTYFYNLDSARSTHLMIDSMHIINSSVTNNVNTRHLQVYIHPGF